MTGSRYSHIALTITAASVLTVASTWSFAQKDSLLPDKKTTLPLFQNLASTGAIPDISSRATLFESSSSTSTEAPSDPLWKKFMSGWKGFSQTEIAYTYTSPDHLSKARVRTELSHQGRFNEHIKWKISGRFDYDAAYDHLSSGFYPRDVRHDQRYEFFIRENYLDISAGNFDFRVGRQHVVWGEMIGLFFADIASAKDMREFVLPAFDILRIPQWAVRAEYTKNDFHAEALWMPVPTFDKIGRPGGDFFPYPLPVPAVYLNEDKSGRNPSHSNYGTRLSYLKNGWDVSGFYYHSLDATQTFYRIGLPLRPTDPLVFQARHDEIDQFGGTLAKDFGTVVLKGEMVFTDGRKFSVTRLTQLDGLVRQNTLDYVLGLDFTLPADIRMNIQGFQRVYFHHDPDILPDKRESGASIFMSGSPWDKVEVQALLIHSLNRVDWMFRPRLSWEFYRNSRLALGADVFGGQPAGLFGRFNRSDRVYTEMRFSF